MVLFTVNEREKERERERETLLGNSVHGSDVFIISQTVCNTLQIHNRA